MNKKIDEILQKIRNLGPNYIVSKQLKEELNVDNIEYIFVADNPGKEEKDGGVYLSNGNTKTNFDNFINEYLKTRREECLILNKSLMQTDSTEDLSGKTNGDESQKLIANLIETVLEQNKDCFVVLMGWTDYFETDEESIFHLFYSKIKSIVDDNSDLKDRFLAFRHPSRGQLFTIKEQNAILGKIPDNKKYFLEFFKYCGRIQFIERQPAREVTDILKEYCEDKEFK